MRARAAVSSEAEMGKYPLPSSHSHWQDSVLCELPDSGAHLAAGCQLEASLRSLPEESLHQRVTASSKPAKESTERVC